MALCFVCCCHVCFLAAVPGLGCRGGGGGGSGGGGGFGGWWVSNPEHMMLQWASLVSFWMTLLLFSLKLKLSFRWTVSARSGGVNGLSFISKLLWRVVATAIIIVRRPS